MSYNRISSRTMFTAVWSKMSNKRAVAMASHYDNIKNKPHQSGYLWVKGPIYTQTLSFLSPEQNLPLNSCSFCPVYGKQIRKAQKKITHSPSSVLFTLKAHTLSMEITSTNRKSPLRHYFCLHIFMFAQIGWKCAWYQIKTVGLRNRWH